MRKRLANAGAHTLFVARLFLISLLILMAFSLVVPKGADVLWINGHHSRLLDSFFKTVTDLGNGIVFVPILIATLFVRYRHAVGAVTASIVHGLLVSFFKRLVFPGASRPIGELDNQLLHFVAGVTVHSSHSFPSGHTATAFCAAMFVALLSKNKSVSVFALVIALLVGYSRVYLLQHFLIDVAAGALIGSITSLLVWQWFESYRKPRWMQQRLAFQGRKIKSTRAQQPT